MSETNETTANETALVLTPPQPVVPIEPARAEAMIKLEPDTIAKLDAQVDEYVLRISGLAPNGAEFQNRVKTINGIGDAEVASSAAMSNRMLDRPVQVMQKGPLAEGSKVSQALLELRKTVEDLDPSSQGNLLSPRKLLGLIPFGNKIDAYFKRYQSAQTHIQSIINALYRGKEELERDNATIEEEKTQMWSLMQRLEQYVHMLKRLDGKLDERARSLDATNPPQAKVLREDVLFYVRQKTTDLLTQTAVNVQGYLALDMIRKTNLELVKGVQRATTTTISALRTAVMVAQALNNQKLVLDQVTALNTTTGNMIEATSAMLKSQSGQVYEQAANSTIEVEKLKRAFQNIYDTMDSIAGFKSKALDHMGKTVEALSAEVEKSKAYVDRVRREQTGAADLAIANDSVVKLS